MKKRVFSMLLTACLIVGLLSVMTLQVGASRDYRKVAFGTHNFTNSSTNYVYLGEDNSNPIKWRVLAESGGNNGTYKNAQDNIVSSDDAMFLLTEYLLGSAMPFSASGEANWAPSEYRTWMNGTLYDGLFTDVEKANILKTTTTNDVGVGGYSAYPYLGACQLDGDALFALSAGEVTNDNYDFNSDYSANDSARVAHIGDETGTTGTWWLRNRQTGLAQRVGTVYRQGCVEYGITTESNYVRPAMNFDTGSIFLSKAADFDKDTVFSMPDSYDEGTEWTLALSDGSSGFNASMLNTVVVPGGNITVNVSALGSGSGYTQVSAVLADGEEILSYGKIGDAATGDTTFSLPIKIRPGEYDLYLFAEDVNGAYLTDYASSYICIKVTITETYWSDDGIRAASFSQIDTTAKTIVITTPQELGLLAYQINQREDFWGYTVTLANDINLAGYLWNPAGLMMEDGSGSDVRAFSGTFDGNGKRIENMLIVDGMDTQYVCAGLFGVAGYADIKNLNLSGQMYLYQNSSDVEDIYIGSVCGMSIDAGLENCLSDVDITAICDGADFHLGGICGVIVSDDSEDTPASVINNCCFGGEIQADIRDSYAKNNIGGIVGLGEGGTLINCAVTGNLTVTADAYDDSTGKGAEIYAGGLLGTCQYKMSVINSYCTGDIDASGEAEDFYVGGIAGLIDVASAFNNYFGGQISADTADIDVGYAFGEEDCFSGDSEILIRYNYYNELFDGIGRSSGDISGYVTGIADSKMRSYAGTGGALVDLLNTNKGAVLFTERWSAFNPNAWFVNDNNNGYPNFTAQTYTVTLETNGGSILSGNVTGYTQGEGAVLPGAANMHKTDGTFAGWFDNANCTGTAVTAIPPTAAGNKIFWAKWIMAPTSIPDVVTYKPVVQSYPYGTIGAKYVINSPWSGFVVSYLIGDRWTVTPPIAVGEYDIRITRDADENTMAYDSGILKKYFIIRPVVSSSSPTNSKPYSESAGVDGQVPYTGDNDIGSWPVMIGIFLSCGAILVVVTKRRKIGGK